MKSLQLTLLYLRRGDQILLALKKRGFGKDKYNGIGGKVDPGESVEQALVRECQEEITVTVTDYQKVGYLVFEEHHEQELKKMHIHIFVSSVWEGNPTETEEMKPQWFNLFDIPYSKMWPADKLWLPTVLEGNKIRGHFVLSENEEVEDYHFDTVSTTKELTSEA